MERASYPLAAPDSRSELDTGESEKGEQDLKKFLAEAETCWDRDVIGFSASGAREERKVSLLLHLISGSSCMRIRGRFVEMRTHTRDVKGIYGI